MGTGICPFCGKKVDKFIMFRGDVVGCRYCGIHTKQTNADRIRAMRDEEMAELLRDYQCNTCDFSGFCEETDKCKEEIFKWLTQEVQQ